ncbi:MAG: EF-hand domain-containing protein [Bacteroidota bacterium]
MNYLQRTFVTVLALLLLTPAFAQIDPLCEEITTWFQEERFLITDQNDDALLSRSEMERFSNEFSYFLDNRHMAIADVNKDGLLSFNEIHSKRSAENVYRYRLERRKLREVARNHPTLAQATSKYLRQHPELVTDLFSNLVWLRENPKLAEKIYKDRRWTATNPEVLVALHRNLRWMAANPTEAQALYKNRNTTRRLPELLGWRADHKAFINQHPQIDRFYEQGFIPGGIAGHYWK